VEVSSKLTGRADGNGQLIDGRDALVAIDEQPFPVERNDLNAERFRCRGDRLTRIEIVVSRPRRRPPTNSTVMAGTDQTEHLEPAGIVEVGR